MTYITRFGKLVRQPKPARIRAPLPYPAIPEPPAEPALPADKGALGGSCNRTACLRPNSAYWYNHSTRKHYCRSCARELNKVNRTDALELFGHDLCTLVEAENSAAA